MSIPLTHLLRWIATSVIIVSMVAVSPAQRTEGSIAGTVTDPNGAAIAKATVTATKTDTGEVYQLTTDNTGYYRAPFVRPGKYNVKIEAQGFRPVVIKDVEVNVNVISRADAEMKVGTVTETINVTGAATLIQTETARLADTFETRQITDLPLNGREIYQLVTLQPGVTAAMAPTISNVPSPNGPGTFDFTFISNGSTPRGNNFVLDGTTNNNEWLGGTPLVYPSVDAIEEFQVQTLNFSAEYGRNNGAVTNIVTKSGGNQLHGSVFYFHRNTALNARNYFDSSEKAPLLQHQYGFSLGGPIRRDRTFFFLSYEGSRRQDGAPERATAETQQFRDLVAAQRPGSIAAGFLRDFPAPTCLPGTQFDAGSLVPGGPGQEFAPPGPPDGIPDYCSVVANQVQKHRFDEGMARFDHNFTEHDKFFTRWIGTFAPTDVSRQQLLNANMRGFQSPLDGYYGDVSVGYTHLFSERLVNDARFAFARNNTVISFQVPDSPTAETLNAANQPNQFAHLSFSDGVIPFGGVVFIPRKFVFNTFTFADTLTYSRGHHTLKYGAELRRIQENSDYKFETMPFYIFDSIWTFANDQPWLVESLVNRDPSSPQFGQFTSTPRHFRSTDWAVFVQDDWKLRPNLTLNLGLRYEVFGVESETSDLLANVILGSGNDIFQRLANPQTRAERVDQLAETDRNNFAPRVGIAWDPHGKGNTVVRSGFSVAYLEPYSNLFTNVSRFLPPDAAWVDSFPFFGVGTDVNYRFPFQVSPDMAAPATSNGAVQGSGLFPPGLNPNIRTAYSLQWFLGVQQQFWRDWAFSINYVGTRSDKLYVREDWNRVTGDICNATACDFTEDRIVPGWFQLFYVDNGTASSYHGMNAQLRKAYGHGLTFVANYTFGKVLDTVSDPGLGDYFNVSNDRYTGTQDVRDRRADYGPSDFDVRHRFTLTALWDLPSVRSNSKFVKTLLGGWQINSVVSWQAGRPFTVACSLQWFDGCDFNMDGTEFDRPNMPAGIKTRGWSTSQFANGIFGATQADAIAVFCPNGLTPFFLGTPCVPPGTNGNMSRNVFRGPAFASVDLAFFKNTRVTERINMQFRTEMFNLFNHSNLYLPVSEMSSPDFGRSLAAFPSRQIQFALKFLF